MLPSPPPPPCSEQRLPPRYVFDGPQTPFSSPSGKLQAYSPSFHRTRRSSGEVACSCAVFDRGGGLKARKSRNQYADSPRGRSQPARYVVRYVGLERLVEPLRYRSLLYRVARDLAHRQQVAVRRGNEYFLRGIQVLRLERLLDHRKACFRRNLHQNPARHSLQAA